MYIFLEVFGYKGGELSSSDTGLSLSVAMKDYFDSACESLYGESPKNQEDVIKHLRERYDKDGANSYAYDETCITALYIDPETGKNRHITTEELNNAIIEYVDNSWEEIYDYYVKDNL